MFIRKGTKGWSWGWIIMFVIMAKVMMSENVFGMIGMNDQQKSVGVIVLVGAIMMFAVIANMKHRNDLNPVDVVPPPLIESDEAPVNVRKAVKVLWFLLVADAVGTIIDLSAGYTSTTIAVLSIIVISLFCIFPYKIGNGSNAARYGYFVVNCLGYALAIAGALAVNANPSPYNNTLDNLLDLIEVPLFTYAFWNLFQPDANKWFTAKKH